MVEAQLLRAALCQEATELGQMVQEVCRDIRGTSVLAEPSSVAASPLRTVRFPLPCPPPSSPASCS